MEFKNVKLQFAFKDEFKENPIDLKFEEDEEYHRQKVDKVFKRRHTEYNSYDAPIFGEIIKKEETEFGYNKYTSDEQANKQLKDVERGHRIEEFAEFCGQIDLLEEEINKNIKNKSLDSNYDTDTLSNEFWEDLQTKEDEFMKSYPYPEIKVKRILYDYNASNISKVRNAYQTLLRNQELNISKKARQFINKQVMLMISQFEKEMSLISLKYNQLREITIAKEIMIRDLTEKNSMKEEELKQFRNYFKRNKQRRKDGLHQKEIKGEAPENIDCLNQDAFSFYNLGVSLDIMDKLQIGKDFVVHQLNKDRACISQDIEKVKSESMAVKEICLKYQKDEERARTKLKIVTAIMKSNQVKKEVVETKDIIIKDLKDKIKIDKRRYQKEISRLNKIAECEGQIWKKIEKQLKGVITKLKNELKYVKMVLRYPKLYHQYKEKKFDFIREGLIVDDIEFLKKEAKGILKPKETEGPNMNLTGNISPDRPMSPMQSQKTFFTRNKTSLSSTKINSMAQFQSPTIASRKYRCLSR
ncbi:unnamed protein product [Moneuplotes crassus]|uniref:DUF4201 domain-containing protein n=1 Tax=Euplotes crassus TaxID=5936 RepID=A0AAD1U4A6_EUPCR|nr:unnamed protein product [Moneuplotes crassus]